MICSSNNNNNNEVSNNPEVLAAMANFTPEELHLLRILFNDLANRSDISGMSKEVFLQLFPLAGLWGEKVWHAFDLISFGRIDYQEFLLGLNKFLKTSEDQKIENLFKFYDQDHDGYIEKDDLLAMLYSYGKDNLDNLSNNIDQKAQNLVQTSSIYQSFSGNKEQVVNLQQTPSQSKGVIARRQSVMKSMDLIAKANESEGFNVNASSNMQPPVGPDEVPDEELLSKRNDVTRDIKNFKGSERRAQLEESKKREVVVYATKLGKPPASNSSIPVPRSNSIFTSAFNFQMKVQRLASGILREYQEESGKGKLSLHDFQVWLKGRPMILKLFSDSFRQEIWGAERIDPLLIQKNKILARKKLHFSRCEVLKQGVMFKKGKRMGRWVDRYYELRDQFLFYYEREGDFLPKGIIFMNGLYIEKLQDFSSAGKYGISISCKYEGYRRQFYCDSQKDCEEWFQFFRSFNLERIEDIYDLKEKINSGKFSIVYTATEKKGQHREVAMKVIDKGKLSPEEKELLISETAIMKTLKHPYVVQLYETIETRTHIYIAMELMKDGDLLDLIRTRGYLEEYEASKIMKQLLEAFLYLQEMSVIHRDIKPENIMCTMTEDKKECKYVKIIDFGFAEFLPPNQQLRESCGTPQYMAPETLGQQGYNQFADNWSLGVLLFYMIRGHLPFEGGVIETIVAKILIGKIQMDDMFWQNVSDEGKDLIGRLLKKTPSERIEVDEALKHPWITNPEALKGRHGVNRNNFKNTLQ